jgi:restriction endonuclease S subunit
MSKILHLGQIASIKTGPFGSQLHQEDYVEIGMPIVTVEHLGQKTFGKNNLPKVSEADYNRLARYQLATGDVVFSRVGSVDRCSYVSEKETGWLFSGRCLRIRPNTHVVTPEYLYYYLTTQKSQKFIRSIAVGATMPSINTQIMAEVPISLPDNKTQSAIAKILGSLDDKIAVNNKIIELALKLAKLLPQCVQQEQQKYKLSEISNLISRGITPKYVEDGFTVLNQKCIRNNLVDLNQARQASNLPKNHERILQQYDVLVNSTGYGTLGRISPWLHETAQLKTVITDTHITTIRFDDQKVDPAFTAMVLSTQENAVANLAEGSTGQTELKRELIENFEIMLPPFAIQHEVSQQIRPLLLAVMTLRNENQTLARTRDELLPLLMSGKITVRDAEEASAEVGVDKHEVEE